MNIAAVGMASIMALVSPALAVDSQGDGIEEVCKPVPTRPSEGRVEALIDGRWVVVPGATEDFWRSLSPEMREHFVGDCHKEERT